MVETLINTKMKNTLAILLSCFITLVSSAQDHQYITTNKSKFVVGDQLLFDVMTFDENHVIKNDEDQPVISMDLVAPSGEIVQTKSLIRTENGCYFFTLADSLNTGIYRLIANSEGAYQAVKRVHIFGLELEESDPRKVDNIKYVVEGGDLVSNVPARVAIRVVDANENGLATKGTLKNSADSVVSYIDTDANGVASFEITPTDSLYTIGFGTTMKSIAPISSTVGTFMDEGPDKIEVMISNTTSTSEAIQIKIDGEVKQLLSLEAYKDTTVSLDKKQMAFGMHTFGVTAGTKINRSYTWLIQPQESIDFNFDGVTLGNNEQSELALEDNADQIDRMCVSVIDQKESVEVNFYEEYFFDQMDLDLQLVENRDFKAYTILFANQLTRKINNDRLSASPSGGVLSYKEEYPFDQLSMLNLKTLKVIDKRNENINGIHDFELAMSGKSHVFPYHFTTYLQPIDLAELQEKVDFFYPKISASIAVSKSEVELIQSYDVQKNINLSYTNLNEEKQQLPNPDYVYELSNFDVPNTMVDMINYIVKYVSVVKNDEGNQELSMYRYMSTYKYRGSPLIFLNDLPVYDARTVLNLNPKDFERVEVRNSYQSNGHLGNFSLNGSVSFYLKEGIDNPLEEAYKDLPVLEPCRNFHKKIVQNEYAPDFRHQLYWNPQLKKTKDAFWVDLKASDLSTTYDVQVMAFMKDGRVVQEKAQITVK